MEKRRQDLSDLTIDQASQIQPSSFARTVPNVVVLPYLPQNLSVLSLERKNNFKATILAIAREASAINKVSESDTTSFVECDKSAALTTHDAADSFSEKSQRFDRLNGIACGTCGGKCCNPGGDHAFLSTSLLRRVLAERPGVSPEEITDDYLQEIPAETYENSCVYHGIHGCGLPRGMRSITCNTFLCSSLQSLRSSVEEGESNFLLAASNVRDAEDVPLEVYRIKVVNDQETVVLKSASGDR